TDELREGLLLLPVAGDRPHAQLDIGPIESSHHNARSREAEQIDDVVADFRRRGCGERGNGRSAGIPVAATTLGGGRLETTVIRPEVVPPFGHAVRLVYNKSGDG